MLGFVLVDIYVLECEDGNSMLEKLRQEKFSNSISMEEVLSGLKCTNRSV